jgi:ribulose 1,5-bisphosphate synthetase/thiazole synthase
MLRVTRRSFLSTATLAGAGAALPGCRVFGNRGVHDVVVLGAGISGLTAGRELVRAGVDTILLEARESRMTSGMSWEGAQESVTL